MLPKAGNLLAELKGLVCLFPYCIREQTGVLGFIRYVFYRHVSYRCLELRLDHIIFLSRYAVWCWVRLCKSKIAHAPTMPLQFEVFQYFVSLVSLRETGKNNISFQISKETLFVDYWWKAYQLRVAAKIIQNSSTVALWKSAQSNFQEITLLEWSPGKCKIQFIKLRKVIMQPKTRAQCYWLVPSV